MNIHTCKRCLRTFWEDEMVSMNGYFYFCRDCHATRQREFRESNREHHRELMKGYNRKTRESGYASNWKHNDRIMHPEKESAWHKVHLYIGKRQPCEVCGAQADAHHEDYYKPLEVKWLCPLHHRRLHHAVK